MQKLCKKKSITILYYNYYLWALSWIGFNCLKAAEPLRRGILLLTTKFPGVSGTHLINLKRMKS